MRSFFGIHCGRELPPPPPSRVAPPSVVQCVCGPGSCPRGSPATSAVASVRGPGGEVLGRRQPHRPEVSAGKVGLCPYIHLQWVFGQTAVQVAWPTPFPPGVIPASSPMDGLCPSSGGPSPPPIAHVTEPVPRTGNRACIISFSPSRQIQMLLVNPLAEIARTFPAIPSPPPPTPATRPPSPSPPSAHPPGPWGDETEGLLREGVVADPRDGDGRGVASGRRHAPPPLGARGGGSVGGGGPAQRRAGRSPSQPRALPHRPP